MQMEGSSTHRQQLPTDATIAEMGLLPLLTYLNLSFGDLINTIGKSMAEVLVDRSPQVRFASGAATRSPAFGCMANPEGGAPKNHYNLNGVAACESPYVYLGVPNTEGSHKLRIHALLMQPADVGKLIAEIGERVKPVSRHETVMNREGTIVHEVLVSFDGDYQYTSSLQLLLRQETLSPRTCRGENGPETLNPLISPAFEFSHSAPDLRKAFGVRVCGLRDFSESHLFTFLIEQEKAKLETGADTIEYFELSKSKFKKMEDGTSVRESGQAWDHSYVTPLNQSSMENFERLGPGYFTRLGASVGLSASSSPGGTQQLGEQEIECNLPSFLRKLHVTDATSEQKETLESLLTDFAHAVAARFGTLTPFTADNSITSTHAGNLVQIATFRDGKKILRARLENLEDWVKFFTSPKDKAASSTAVRLGAPPVWDKYKATENVKAINSVFVMRGSNRATDTWKDSQLGSTMGGKRDAYAMGGVSDVESRKRHDSILQHLTTMHHAQVEGFSTTHRMQCQARDQGAAIATSMVNVHQAVMEGNRHTHAVQDQHTSAFQRTEGVMNRLAVANQALGEAMAMSSQPAAAPQHAHPSIPPGMGPIPREPPNSGFFFGAQGAASTYRQQVSNT